MTQFFSNRQSLEHLKYQTPSPHGSAGLCRVGLATRFHPPTIFLIPRACGDTCVIVKSPQLCCVLEKHVGSTSL